MSEVADATLAAEGESIVAQLDTIAVSTLGRWQSLHGRLEAQSGARFVPIIRRLPWIGACLLGAGIVVIVGAACLYAASHGGPHWMVGREVSIFLKLAALTAIAVVVDICWRALDPPEQAVEQKSHHDALAPSESVEIPDTRISGELLP